MTTDVTQFDNDKVSEPRTSQEIRQWLVDKLSGLLAVDPGQIDVHKSLLQCGLDSVNGVVLAADLENWLGCEIPYEEFFDVPSIEELASHLAVMSQDAQGSVASCGATDDHRNGDGFAPLHEDANRDQDRSTWCLDEFPEFKQLEAKLAEAKSAGIDDPYFTVHEAGSSGTCVIGGQEFINFASYNYLGYSGDPTVNQAVINAVERYGTSVSASRVVSGERLLHSDLEQALADFLRCEDVVVTVGGHATNVSLLGHLLGPKDVLVHDSLAHDCILGGAQQAACRRRSFPHNDVEALDRILDDIRPNARRVLIAVEGIYSMDGDIAPLDRIVEIAKRHRALLFVDEAHSIGVLGETGRGVGEHFGINREDVDIWMGTLSKSLASCGGYIAGSKSLVHYLKCTMPGFVYSVGLSPPNAAAALSAIQQLKSEPGRVETLQQRASCFYQLCKQRGIEMGSATGVPIIPCLVPNTFDCVQLSKALYRRHVYALPIVYPAVEEGMARLRFFITSQHSEEQLRYAADALSEELGKINPKYLKDTRSNGN